MEEEFGNNHQVHMIGWPSRHGTWRKNCEPARAAVAEYARVVSQAVEKLGRKVTLWVVAPDERAASSARDAVGTLAHVHVAVLASDDSWLRDISPLMVRTDHGRTAVAPAFNAWGGLYRDFAKDAAFGAAMGARLGHPVQRADDFVLEGGAISVNGCGDLLTTQECLLHPTRNPSMSQSEIEARLCALLGVRRVVWLPEGVYGDSDTNGHVDNLAVFLSASTVALHVPHPDDAAAHHPQAARSAAARSVLESAGFRVVPVAGPRLLRATAEEREDLAEEPDALPRPFDEMPASYVNFAWGPNCLIVPGFGQPDCDEAARAVLQAEFPGRDVFTVQSREILLGGGNWHCMTKEYL